MSEPAAERLYQRLPAIHRLRDVDQGQALRALLAVIEREVEDLEEDIARLYDNWFIETCDEWVVSYIGDLLGVRGLLPLQEGTFSLRGLVANTLGYRRRKGTAAVLEQLARDVTGWPAKVVEFFELLATTQHLNHVRLGKGGSIGLRDSNALELLNTPFEHDAHTAEVRHIDSNRGHYNISNVGLFLWRLQSYAIRHGSPRPVVDPADGRYRFASLGYDTPLFNRPRTETDMTHLAEEVNVPGRLRRRALYDELEALRQSLVAGHPPRRVYFGDSPVLEVFVQKTNSDLLQPIPPEEMVICHLSDWKRPEDTTYTKPDGGTFTFTTQVAVDPVLGRLVFPVGSTPFRVEVSYAYGFSGDLGGGPYNRQSSVAQWYDPSDVNRPVTWQRGVTQNQQTLNASPDPTQLVRNLHDALEAWKAWTTLHPNQFGLITVMDSGTYDADLTLEIPAGSTLAIVAADWPLVEVSDPLIPQKRFSGQLRPDGVRPTLVGNVSVQTTPTGSSTPGELILDGLLLEGALTVMADGQISLGNLRIGHCTLVPGRHLDGAGQPQDPERPSLSVEATHDRLTINIDHSIVGPLRLPSDIVGLQVHDSIIDSPARGRPAQITPGLVSGSLTSDQPAIAANDAGERPGPPTTLVRTSVLGPVHVNELILASETIFTDVVIADRRQAGCVRFCYVPAGSRTPSRYRCQPELAIQKALEIANTSNPALTPAARDRIIGDLQSRLTPSFTSVRYGEPGYGQLSQLCAEEIRTGAEDEGEMGAFNFLQQAHRRNNLHASLDEYLRFGLEAGLFFVT